VPVFIQDEYDAARTTKHVAARTVSNRVVIHQPTLPMQIFLSVGGRMQLTEHDEALERTALAHLLRADRGYRERLYRLPADPPK
jgi:hypothetical protein